MSGGEKRDPFEELGITEHADDAEILSAWRKAAKARHPDSGGDAASFQRAQDAYAELRDPAMRAAAVGRRRRSGAAAPTKGFKGFDSFFDDIERNGRGRDIRSSAPARGLDAHREVTLSLAEAFAGGRFRVEGTPGPCVPCAGKGRVPAPGGATCASCSGGGRIRRGRGMVTVEVACPDCSGRGRVAHRACPACAGSGQDEASGAAFEVPPGVDDGFSVTLPGLGGRSAAGGPSGDLSLTVCVEMQGGYARKGRHLALRVRIPVWTAAIGGEVAYGAPSGGTARLRVPPGSGSGRRLRVGGAGMPSPEGPGDLVVTLDVEVPDAAGGEMRAAFERVRALASGEGASRPPAGAGSAR